MKIIDTRKISVSLREAQYLSGLNTGVLKKAIECGYIEDKQEGAGRHGLNLYDVYKFCDTLHSGHAPEFSQNVLLLPLGAIEKMILNKYA